MKIAALLLYTEVQIMELKLYTIDNDYLSYLFEVDDRVMFWEGNSYKNERKYVGVVLTINNFEYFAPLSSPKDTDYYYKDSEKKIRKNIIPIVRLVTDDGDLLAKVKLCSMIPVKSEYITLYDITTEPDQKYQSLITKEMVCIRKQTNEIIKNARVLYNQKAKGYSNIKYLEYTIDFKKLEAACLKYGEPEDTVEEETEE